MKRVERVERVDRKEARKIAEDLNEFGIRHHPRRRVYCISDGDRLMNELVFEVTQDVDGGFVAECLTESMQSKER